MAASGRCLTRLALLAAGALRGVRGCVLSGAVAGAEWGAMWPVGAARGVECGAAGQCGPEGPGRVGRATATVAPEGWAESPVIRAGLCLPSLLYWPPSHQHPMGSATRHESASSSRRSASQEASDKHKKDGAEEALKRLQEHVHRMAAKKETEGRLPEPSVAVMSLLGELGSVPNALSLSRVFFGPVVAYWVVEDMWGPAVVGLAVAGASDWLDGYVAKRQGQQSVLGSYLDPFADKVLIGCVVAALVYKGSLPAWVAGTVIARDLFLVAGTVAHHSGRTKTPGLSWKELLEAGRGGQLESGNVRLVQPLFVSKVNTVVQLMLVASCMSQGLMGWPGDGEILSLSYATVCTTLLSWGAYARGYLMGSSRLP